MDLNKNHLERLEKRISHLKSSFAHYNMVRMREALRYLSAAKLELFVKIPFLIHINLPGFPGFVESETPAHGIYNFEQSGFYKEALKHNMLPERTLSRCNPVTPCVQGFYHMGSLGTFTQSAGSDFDYWVIIDKTSFSQLAYYNLEKKLNQILKFSRETYDQEVTFFIMDQTDLQQDCYARFDESETLAAPKIFLKEEFYRTFLMIAGKIPFWTLVPGSDDLKTYNALVKNLSSLPPLKPISQDFIDLGYVEKPGNQEIIKGLLWHICKSRFDPVKALIKASMIFSHGFDTPEPSQLLCNQIKAGYAQAGIDDYGSDPYKLLFDLIIKFHQENDPAGLNLIQTAIFFRLCGYPRVMVPETGSPKKQLLDRYIRDWNMSQNQVNQMLSYPQWPEAEKQFLEQTIVNRLTHYYQTLHKKFASAPAQPAISDPDKRNFKILVHKTKERLNRAAGKIKEGSLYLKQQKFQTLIIQHNPFSGWHLSGYPLHQALAQKLHQDLSLLGLVGWLLENQLYHRSLTTLKIDTPACLFESHATPADPDKLYLALQPVKPLSDDDFEATPSWSKLMILLIYTQKESRSCLEKAEFLALNTWGELFVDILELETQQNLGDTCGKIALKINQYHSLDLRLFFFQLALEHDPDAVFTIKQHLAAREQNVSGTPFGRKRPLLDRL